MSALDIITEKQKKEMTGIERAIFTLWNSFSEDELAEEAAEEYEAIFKQLEGRGKQIAALRARVEALEHLEAIAEDVNEWLKTSANLKGSAHQRELEAALKS